MATLFVMFFGKFLESTQNGRNTRATAHDGHRRKGATTSPTGHQPHRSGGPVPGRACSHTTRGPGREAVCVVQRVAVPMRGPGGPVCFEYASQAAGPYNGQARGPHCGPVTAKGNRWPVKTGGRTTWQTVRHGGRRTQTTAFVWNVGWQMGPALATSVGGSYVPHARHPRSCGWCVKVVGTQK
jgi:hypothetical protein